MRIIKYTTFLLCFGLTVSFGQGNSFIKAYGNSGYDFGRDIKQDNDSGYVVTGSSSSFADDGEAYLLKLDKNGDFEWSWNYGGSASEWGESLVITEDSTYAIAGYTNSYGAGGFDCYLVRIDALGSPIWENYYGGSNWDKAYGLVQLPDGGFILAGESYSFHDGKRSGYLVRTDADGTMVWQLAMDGPESFFTDIDLDGDSIVMCGGIADGGTDTYDAYVVKYNIDGTFGWDRTIGGVYNDQFNAVQSIGGFYSFGGARGYNYPTEDQNMWMYRMSDIGVEVVDTVYVNESLEIDAVNDISIRGDQDYAFVGETKSYGYAGIDGKYEIFMAKMNTSFTHFASRTYGEAGDDKGQAIDRTRDNGAVYLADTKYFSTGGNNLLVIKVDATWVYPDLVDDEDNFTVVFDDITSSLPNDAETIDLTVYPNPFNDLINLPEINDGFYSIYSIDGQLIQEGKIINQQLELGHLKSGLYLLTVQTADGIYKKRLIKN